MTPPISDSAVARSGASAIRTRFAPSPSGHLHVGGARTALYCWAFARANGGKFILRIEDTDQKRSSDASSMAFLEDLHWLGLNWDEGPEYHDCGGGEAGPYFQSERVEIYNEHVDRLIASGKAYRAFETPDEINAQRKRAQAEKREYRYDRAALQLDDATIQRYLREGRPHVVRFHTPDGSTTFHDEILGDITIENEKLDDFIIRKADGYPTYHFAVVVDDELMGVTHVLRAQEHLYNTPRHILLQEALNFRRPVYGHLSIIFNPDGSKMSKRDKAKVARAAILPRWSTMTQDERVDYVSRLARIGRNVNDAMAERLRRHTRVLQDVLHVADSVGFRSFYEDVRQFVEKESDEIAVAELIGAQEGLLLPEINVQDFRRSGYLPNVLLKYLMLLGWSPGEEIERAEGKPKEEFEVEYLTRRFDLKRLSASPAKFDRDTLLAFNLQAIQRMSPDEFERHLRAHGERYHPDFLSRLGANRFTLFAQSNQQRSKTLDDPFRTCRFLIMRDGQIEYERSKPVRKALEGGSPTGLEHLDALKPILAGLEDWSVESIHTTLQQYADQHAEGNMGRIGQPLRIAVTGTTMSPSIFETLAMLGRESVVNRIARCIETFQNEPTPKS